MKRLGCYAAGALGLAVVVAVLYSVQYEEKDTRKSICMANLKVLMFSMLMYAEDHDGVLPSAVLNDLKVNGVRHRGEPERFWSLVGPYAKDRSKLHCPHDKRSGELVSYEQVDLPTDLRETSIEQSEASRIKLFRDLVWLGPDGKPKSFHPDQWITVAYGDGHVKGEPVSEHRPVTP